MHIRPIRKEDLPALKSIIDSTGLFPSELLDGMTADFFTNPDSADRWLTGEVNGIPGVIAYYAPERMTEGTFNLYLIAVDQNHQGKGIGAEMMHFVENQLRQEGHRILLVETSSLPEYDRTRKFYEKLRYSKEAVIRDFYKEGEDKVVYWKRLI